MNAPGQAVRHVVLFAYDEKATPAEVQAIEAAFAALPAAIPGITGFEHGSNTSPEELHQGFTHCHLVTFADAAARDAYLVHPAHTAFVERLRPVLAKALVVDFQAERTG